MPSCLRTQEEADAAPATNQVRFEIIFSSAITHNKIVGHQDTASVSPSTLVLLSAQFVLCQNDFSTETIGPIETPCRINSALTARLT
jgi:hypothetical protein